MKNLENYKYTFEKISDSKSSYLTFVSKTLKMCSIFLSSDSSRLKSKSINCLSYFLHEKNLSIYALKLVQPLCDDNSSVVREAAITFCISCSTFQKEQLESAMFISKFIRDSSISIRRKSVKFIVSIDSVVQMLLLNPSFVKNILKYCFIGDDILEVLI